MSSEPSFFHYADKSGNFPPLPSTSTGLSGGAIVGISIGAIRAVLLLAGLVYVGCYRNKAHLHQSGHGPASSTTVKAAGSDGLADGNSPGLSGISVDKYVEFTYEELATSTNDFSIANKIGQGGSGAVYYAELRGKKAAIKKMDMEAMREFLAELKVLTNVHHLNLVADFGLTKLTKVGSSSLQTRLVGTFGYMPLEYAQYGDVSPKVDVYAFGVVLYELISAKEAIVKPNGSVTDSKGLVALLNSFCIFLFSVVRLHGSFISLSRIIFF
ncbi:lysM domain receptor-like kinase 3 isoform X7 [Capsicum annuum]|uniref:lysM domain receptor-like kinase 3 isoform X7 n=1 Tax=Capsicum annuum TaxID=4072 RepID=UPI001FB08639|nr:lysM domain receptor-like kinase 3 isoform X7 [Capsicum annuum]